MPFASTGESSVLLTPDSTPEKMNNIDSEICQAVCHIKQITPPSRLPQPSSFKISIIFFHLISLFLIALLYRTWGNIFYSCTFIKLWCSSWRLSNVCALCYVGCSSDSGSNHSDHDDSQVSAGHRSLTRSQSDTVLDSPKPSKPKLVRCCAVNNTGEILVLTLSSVSCCQSKNSKAFVHTATNLVKLIVCLFRSKTVGEFRWAETANTRSIKECSSSKTSWTSEKGNKSWHEKDQDHSCQSQQRSPSIELRARNQVQQQLLCIVFAKK